jgi:hypothetical protein
VRAFELAGERFPSAEYFAWASDHDLWADRWLEALVERLDELSNLRGLVDALRRSRLSY